MSLIKSRSQKNFFYDQNKFSLFQNYTNSTKFQTIFSNKNQTNFSFFNNNNNNKNNSTFYNTKKYLNCNSGFNVFDISSKYKYDNLILFEKQKINKEKNKIFRHSTTKNLYKIEKKMKIETKIENEKKILNSHSTKILNILSEMKNNFIKKKQEKFDFSLVENKNILITQNYEKINNEKNKIELIKKFNEIKLNKNKINNKKEIFKQIKENFENKIELLNLKYEKLLRNEKILKNFNFNEFVRIYKNKKEIEKNEDLKLINKINELKNINKDLNKKINKLINEKNSILRWIFLQIKIKEKIIEIPNYYKIIFDLNENEIKNFILSNNNFYYKKFNSTPIKRKSLKIRKNSFDNLINNSKNNSPKRMKKNIKNDNNNNLLKGISNEEIIRILNYKNNLIFDCDEFLNNFSLFENSNLYYLNIYNEKKIEINELNKIKNLLLNEEKNNEKYELNLINEFNNNLNLVKNSYKKLLKEKNVILKNIENENKNNEKNIIKKNYNNHQKDFFNLKISSYNKNNLNDNNNKYKNLINNIEKKLKKSKIYSKIKFLYLNIIENSNEKNLNLNNNNILNILLKIEFFINNLLTKNKKYKFLFKEKYNFIKFNLDKRKKHKYLNIQKEKDLKKEILMKQKIENNINKLYFLPIKKISNYDIIFSQKKPKIKKIPSKQNFTFEDFMYDSD